MWITITLNFDCSHVKHVNYYHKFFFPNPDDGGCTEYKVEIHKESGDRDIWRGIITSIDTITQVFIIFRKKKKENKRMGINVEQNTKTYM